ncbi:MAG: DUF4347 domain-containing protein, partial [Planctomycetota bacterium]
MERLEDRILFDAVPDGGFLIQPEAEPFPISPQSEEVTDVQNQSEGPRELIIIDAQVADADALISSILEKEEGKSYEVRLLDASQDGVEQIGKFLSSPDQLYDAVHILSHAADNALQLGNTVLSATNLQGYASSVAAWSNGLSAQADLLFYGCNLAESSAGEQLIEDLSLLTGADVAASSDLTGHAKLGGDWELEHQVGLIDAKNLSIGDYFNTLNVFVIQATTDVVVDGDGGVGTTGTWLNAGFVDTDPTVDSDGDGDFENDQDQNVNMVATVIGVTGTASVDFETVSTTDPTRDDMRARISGDGTATIRWEIFDAATNQKPTEGRIGLTISDIDGAGSPETVEGIAASLHNLSSYTLQSPTNLDVTVDNDFLVAQGTQNQNDERPSWVRFDWSTANELVLTYYVYDNGTRFFNHDGDGDLVFTNPDTSYTQGLDLDMDDSSGASGSNYQTTYIDGSIPGVAGDVPVSIADADITVFDLNDTTLQGATITLTNASAGDQLNVNTPLLAALGINANVDTSDPNRIVVELSGVSLIENYETAIKSITYSNTNATFDKSYVRVVEVFATDGTNVTGTANTTISFSNAVNSPTAAADFYVMDEDTGPLIVDAATGLLANDDDPQGDNITVVGATDSNGNSLTIGSLHNLASGSTILIRADGSLEYTPADHLSGAEFLNYDIEDTAGNTATAFVTLNVEPVADLPVLVTSYTSTTVNEDSLSTPLNITSSTPDSDGSETLSLVASAIPMGATLTDGTNTFTAGSTNSSVDISSWDITQLQFQAAMHSDVDQSITLTLTSMEPNGSSQSVTQQIQYSVNAVADAPTVTTSNVSGGRNQVVSLSGAIGVSLVDADGSETITSILISNIPAGAEILDNGVPLTILSGSVTVTQSQLANLSFNPPPNTTNIFTLQVYATSAETNPENGVATPTATTGPIALVIDINEVDEGVTAHTDVASVGSGGSVIINVLDNDEVPDGGAVVTQVDGQSISAGQTINLSSGQGTVRLESDGTLTYSAAATATGTIQFTYTVADGDGDDSQGTVYVSVYTIVDDDSAITPEDTDVTISVFGNDAVLPSTVTVQTATDGTNGTASVNGDGTISYSPASDFFGTDSFNYTVTGLAEGLQYQFFDSPVSWDSVDDIPEQDPDFVGVATDLDSAALANALTGSNRDYGVRYFGKLYVESADNYEFSLNSNNGSRLWINSTLVADNDNAAGSSTNFGNIFLNAGYHDILIEHYDWGGGANLIARMNGADTGGVSTNLLSTGRIGAEVVTQTATVGITVTPVNDDPMATDDDLAGGENQTLTGNVITDDNGNGVDSDTDGDALTVSEVNGSAANLGSNITGSAGGTFNISSTGAYTFAPGSDFDY